MSNVFRSLLSHFWRTHVSACIRPGVGLHAGPHAGPCTSKHKGRVIEETIYLGRLQLIEKAEIRPLGDTKCPVRWRSPGAVLLPMLQLHIIRVSWR